MADHRTAYVDRADASSGPAVSLVERALLCDLFDEVGPDAPTLCRGWTTHHLAAHVRIREASTIDLRLLLPGRADAAVEAAVTSTDFGELVEKVRNGPPLLSFYSLPKVEPIFNDLEFFVHHEDVRRAAADWEARTLPRWANDQLWTRLLGFSKLLLRKSPVGVILEPTDAGETKRVASGDDPATLAGPVSELVMYLFGRRRAADVVITGSDDAIARFTRKKLDV